MSLEGLKTTDIPLADHGVITVHFIDSIEHYRSARLRGITWWVNQRRVGERSWDRLDDEGAYLDGRTEHAKKFSFIVMADFLTPGQDVKADWSDFHANQLTNDLRQEARSTWRRRWLRNRRSEGETGGTRSSTLGRATCRKNAIGSSETPSTRPSASWPRAKWWPRVDEGMEESPAALRWRA